MLGKKWPIILFLMVAVSLPTLAQTGDESEADDNFDPFSDYSEYVETTEEEADINFFRTGRLLNMSLHGGFRNFTDTLGQLNAPGLTYGLGLTYFFDLRFAGYLGFSTSDHDYTYTYNNQTRQGSTSISFLSFDLKYYLDTDVLVKPLSELNPYWFVGFNQTFRGQSLAGLTGIARDSALGLELGVGLEVPILRNQAFMGFQFTYRQFSFTDERQPLIDFVNAQQTNITPNGDAYDLLFLLGLNF